MVTAENLQQLFRPTSVAVIGASYDPQEPGNVIMRNLTQGKFLGPVMPLNEEQEVIMGIESYRSVDTLPLTPDLAVICFPGGYHPYLSGRTRQARQPRRASAQQGTLPQRRRPAPETP